jgi:hypothetical protein
VSLPIDVPDEWSVLTVYGKRFREQNRAVLVTKYGAAKMEERIQITIYQQLVSRDTHALPYFA